MLRRVFVMISVGLADSINPSTVGPALYLSTARNRVLRVTQFTAGVFRPAPRCPLCPPGLRGSPSRRINSFAFALA